MKIRIIVHRNESDELYISSVIEDGNSITLYPDDVSAVYVDEIEAAKSTMDIMGIDIQPILDFEANL